MIEQNVLDSEKAVSVGSNVADGGKLFRRDFLKALATIVSGGAFAGGLTAVTAGLNNTASWLIKNYETESQQWRERITPEFRDRLKKIYPAIESLFNEVSQDELIDMRLESDKRIANSVENHATVIKTFEKDNLLFHMVQFLSAAQEAQRVIVVERSDREVTDVTVWNHSYESADLEFSQHFNGSFEEMLARGHAFILPLQNGISRNNGTTSKSVPIIDFVKEKLLGDQESGKFFEINESDPATRRSVLGFNSNSIMRAYQLSANYAEDEVLAIFEACNASARVKSAILAGTKIKMLGYSLGASTSLQQLSCWEQAKTVYAEKYPEQAIPEVAGVGIFGPLAMLNTVDNFVLCALEANLGAGEVMRRIISEFLDNCYKSEKLEYFASEDHKRDFDVKYALNKPGWRQVFYKLDRLDVVEKRRECHLRLSDAKDLLQIPDEVCTELRQRIDQYSDPMLLDVNKLYVVKFSNDIPPACELYTLADKTTGYLDVQRVPDTQTRNEIDDAKRLVDSRSSNGDSFVLNFFESFLQYPKAQKWMLAELRKILLRMSPLAAIQSRNGLPGVGVPIYVCVGEFDQLIPKEQSMQVVQELQQFGQPVVFEEIWGGHYLNKPVIRGNIPQYLADKAEK